LFYTYLPAGSPSRIVSVPFTTSAMVTTSSVSSLWEEGMRWGEGETEEGKMGREEGEWGREVGEREEKRTYKQGGN